MKKTYLLVPLAALLLFGVVYRNFDRGYAQREQAARDQARLEREIKLKAEAEARTRSIEDALRLQALRKKEREEREAREREAKEARQLAIDARDKAFRDHDSLSRQIERIKKDIAAEQAAQAEIAATVKATEAERVFLKEHLARAEENLRALDALLKTIAAADAAGAAAGPAGKNS